MQTLNKLIDRLDQRMMLMVLIVLTVFVTLFPTLISLSLGHPLLVGQEPYYSADLAKIILNAPSELNNFLLDNGPYYNPYHFLLAGFGYFFDMEVSVIIISVILSVLSVLLFYFTLKNFKIDKDRIFLSTIFFIFSSSFLFFFSSMTSFSLLMMLSLLCFYCFSHKNDKLVLLSVLTLIPLYFFGLFSILSTLAFLFLYSIIKKEKSLWFLVSFFIIFFLYILNPANLFQAFETVNNLSVFSLFFSNLGAKIGFGFFYILTAISGAIFFWTEKKKTYPLYILGLMFIITSFFFYFESMLYLGLLVSIFAGFGFHNILSSNWEVKLLQNLTVLIILAGILFSFFSSAFIIADSGPSLDTVKSLKFLREGIPKDSVILSSPYNSFYIKYISKKETVIDNFDLIYHHDEIITDYNTMLKSINLETTQDLFEDYSVDYIFINENFNPSLLPKTDKKGLFFLFRNNETFKKVYGDEEIKIYKILD